MSEVISADQVTGLLRIYKKANRRLMVAIDGRCASGKTTLADLLAKNPEVTIFHMDEFFLRPEQRTEERINMPGGNVDYERFLAEVLLPLRNNEEVISLRAYDCKTQTMLDPVNVKAGGICIVEGAYSCHPKLWDYYDLHVFMDVSADEQKRRVAMRNGTDGLKAFVQRWIPLEEKYFEEYQIKEKCEYCIGTTMQGTGCEAFSERSGYSWQKS